MFLSCAPSCLTFSVLLVAKRNLRMKMKSTMKTERRLISSSASPSSTSFPDKRSTENSAEDDVLKSDALENQSSKGNASMKLEGMTFHQLRTLSKNCGIPARGSKNDLLLALKCFLDSEKKEFASSEMPPKEGSSSSPNIVSEGPSKQRKRVRKQSTAEADGGSRLTAEGSSGTVSMDQVTVNGAPVVSNTALKPSPAQREEKSRIRKESRSTGGVGLSGNHSEPWTVFAHKRPQQGWIPYNPRTMRPPALSDDTKSFKLISWNVNGLRALLKLEGFSALELAKRENFDVLCLQETKLQEKNVEEIKRCLIEGYDNSFWTCSNSKLGYSGTAIISRIKPLSVRYGLGIEDHDSEGRLVTVEFDTFYLLSGYVPNSGDGLRRLTYRITQWDPSLSNYMKELEKSKPVILTGDLNCAHEEIDIYNPAGNRRSAGFTDEERHSFETNFLSKGFVDTFRKQHPGVVGYTFWGYRHGGRVVNKGWRLDYFLVSGSIAEKVHDSYILPDVLGSDHCPIGLILKI